jgi:hypothetical protein
MMKSGKAAERTVVDTVNRLAQDKSYVRANYLFSGCLVLDILHE